jgi:hypothetical protein
MLVPLISYQLQIPTQMDQRLKLRCKTVELLEENLVKTFHYIGLWKDFLAMLPNAQSTKAKMNELDYIKQKSFCITKEIVNRLQRQPTEWEEVFSNRTSDKELIFTIFKEFK